ncbi:MAG: translation elongation factor Ts [Candidatus Coatesbacteria bacterium]|nr:MAG: translation elongation factor Ts [Candidatus Coatesbacteria bacterium]
MPEVTVEMIKALRQKTNCGIMDCKRALVEADGDEAKAIKLLRKQGLAKAVERRDRSASEGAIFSYVHHDGRIGVLLQLNCETDFVARTDEFRQLGSDLCLQVAASAPRYVSQGDVPENVLESERNIFGEQAAKMGKPKNVIERIVEGKLKSFYEQVCLLDQTFVKEPNDRVGQMIDELSSKLGEKIEVGRFARFEISKS